MKVKAMIKVIENDGWFLVRQKGSHRQYRHDIKKGIVTIAGKDTMDLHPKVVGSILKQARLAKETTK